MGQILIIYFAQAGVVKIIKCLTKITLMIFELKILDEIRSRRLIKFDKCYYISTNI